MTDEEVRNIAPLQDARLGEAEAIRQAGREALQEQLASIRTRQRARGFSGDSAAQNLLEFDARRTIGTEASLAEARAKVENARDEANIKNLGVRRKVANVGLPSQVQESTLNAESAGDRALVREAQTAFALFEPFNIGTGTYQPTPLPQVQPIIGDGAIFGTALAQLGGAATSLGTSGALGSIGTGGAAGGTPVAVNSTEGSAFGNQLDQIGRTA